jgi:hypothetical protein
MRDLSFFVRAVLEKLSPPALEALASRCLLRVQPLLHAALNDHPAAGSRAALEAAAVLAELQKEARAAAAARASLKAAAASGALVEAARDAAALRDALAAVPFDSSIVFLSAGARVALSHDTSPWTREIWLAVAAGGRAADLAYESDFKRLLALDLGASQDVGQPIDTSESGPLGPLWPEGPPAWYAATEGKRRRRKSHARPRGGRRRARGDPARDCCLVNECGEEDLACRLNGALREAGYRVLCRSRRERARIDRRAWVVCLGPWSRDGWMVAQREIIVGWVDLPHRSVCISLHDVHGRPDDLELTEAEGALVDVIRMFCVDEDMRAPILAAR